VLGSRGEDSVLSNLFLIPMLVACSEQSFNPVDKPNELDTDTDVGTDTDTDIVPVLSPDIEVTPLQIDFGSQPVGQAQVSAFEVQNIGDAPLTVTSMTLVDSTAFALGGSTAFLLDPGEVTVVDVTYLPVASQSTGIARIASDDPDEPEVDVMLLGTGAVPDLQVSPMYHDFGAVEATCEVSKSVWLSNIGGDLLTIDSIDFVDLDGSLWLDQPNLLPLDLAPGNSAPVEVFFAPVSSSANGEGSLTVVSNDPDGDVVATLVGSSFADMGTDSVVVPPDPPLDIIFAVDQSGSMDARNADMAAALDDFVAGLGAVTADWRIGVVTFDDGCLNTWFDQNTPNYGPDFDAAVLAGSQSGPNNDDTERLFTLAGRALDGTLPGGCNAAFRRPDGFLHLIMISDENEQSNDPFNTRVPYDTVPGALGVYEGFVQSPGMLTVSAVANITNSCQSQPDALAQGADRYISLAGLTGGLALDICTNNWGPQMANLGSSLPTEYNVPLSDWPDPTSLSVTADGALLLGGWSYDPLTNSVQIQTVTGLLAAGTVIEVQYTVPAVCP